MPRADNVTSTHTGDRSVSKANTAKLGYVIAAGISFLLSVYLWFTGHKDQGVYVGLWVPSILSFGSLMLQGRKAT